MLVATVNGNTEKGLVRDNNEDAYIAKKIWDDNHWLLVVIDGLGGYEGGEVAASIAKATILQTAEESKNKDCLDTIMQSVVDANNAICNKRDSDEGFSDMGCVITAAILDLEKKQLNVAHVGDTRMYQCDSNGLVKLTHDHSFVGGLEDDGYISEKDAMNHPRRNLVDRVVGDELKDIETPRFIEAAVFPVTKGNQYMLCSDGLSDMITSREISSILKKGVNVKKKVNQLINAANRQGGKDNITVIVAIVSSEKEKIIGRNRLSKGEKRKNTKRDQRRKHHNKILILKEKERKENDSIYKIVIITMFFVLIILAILILINSNL